MVNASLIKASCRVSLPGFRQKVDLKQGVSVEILGFFGGVPALPRRNPQAKTPTDLFSNSRMVTKSGGSRSRQEK